MRKTFGSRLFVAFAGSALVAAAFLVACSGSDDQEVMSPTPDASKASLPETGPSPDTGVQETSAPKDSGPVYDAGAPTTLDGGDLYEGGVPCVVGGALEEEPNDDPEHANTLAPTVCGVIFVRDADAGTNADADAGKTESDFVTFTLKPTTKSFFLQFSGKVNLHLTVEGQPAVDISATSSPTLPLVKDKPYYIEIRSSEDKRTPWRVTLFENQ
ncbi:hypothetical protein AKJ09_00097 [Labilithrix luteola]|uniref:Lipoprotein n=1 Tax=Labilithrix luteola TaxID=1391654 RepID=A0A0K1PIR0_9BACT|nr:hypothetical protein [Labilithrix luteola]AKU93433.1 hypothetical protein AKJ09_00097 [Labilithrix luteola]